MSLRYASKVGYEAWVGMKDQTLKCDSAVKCLRDSSSKVQARCFSGGAAESTVSLKDGSKYKQAEEALRTVMYLSCWAPN